MQQRPKKLDEGVKPEENSILKQCDFEKLDQSTLPLIKNLFNQDDNGQPRKSIIKKINFSGFSLFVHRLLKPNQLRLVQRNGKPELVTYSGSPERRTKVWSLWKPWTWFRAFRDNSSTVDIMSFATLEAKGVLGEGDRHLTYIKQGHVGKATINGIPQLLQPGVHVIKSANFKFTGQVKQSERYITHENCHFLQIPEGKLAAVIIDNEPCFLETGDHLIRSNNFKLIKKGDALFHDYNDGLIQCGNLTRLLPSSGKIAVYSIGNTIKTYPEYNDGQEKTVTEPLILTNPNVTFKKFITVNLVNRNYPDEKDGIKYYEYYTKDSVKVGVKLYVAYQIFDPKLVLARLDPDQIEDHIKHLTHVDMSAAGQETSLQQIQSTDMGHINIEDDDLEDPGAPSAPQFIRTWQDMVKHDLSKDLKDYGIKLVRVNIEDLKILDPEVEKNLAEQSYGVAKTNAQLAALGMQREVTMKSAELKVEVAEKEAQATNIAAQAKANSLQVMGEVYQTHPELLQLKIAEYFATAFRDTDKLISPELMQQYFTQGLFGSAQRDPQYLGQGSSPVM